MAPITKKTYSRKNNELQDSCIKEKENIDPFDELVSSPLKQEVQFKPLSFWGKKVKNLESKNKCRTVTCGLYEVSDSDDPSSPTRRNRKPKPRSGVLKRSKLQLRPANYSLKETNTNPIALGPFVNLRKPYKFFVSNNKLDDVSLIAQKSYVSEKRVENSNKGIYNLQSLLRLKESNIEKLIEHENEGRKVRIKSDQETLGGSNCDDSNMDMTCEDIKLQTKGLCGRMSILPINDYLGESINSSCSNEGSSTILYIDETMQETQCVNDSWGLPEMKFQDGSTLSTSFSLSLLDVTAFEAQGAEEVQDGTTAFDETEVTDKSLDDETIGNFSSDESTIIQNSLYPKRNSTFIGGCEGTLCENVSHLTTKMSDMTISNENVTDVVSSESENDAVYDVDEPDSSKATTEAFRNVTTRRRYNCGYSKKTVTPRTIKSSQSTFRENESDGERDSDGDFEYPSIILKDSTNLDHNRMSCFANPVFESTRMFDNVEESRSSSKGGRRRSFFEGTQCLDGSFNLKPGKKWFRSMSVLKKLRNGNLYNNLESTRIKGRRYESFVQDMLEMQNDISGFSTILADTTSQNVAKELKNTARETSCLFTSALDLQVSPDEDFYGISDINDSSMSKSVSKGFERTVMNHTVKICEEEKSGDKTSAFRSALGLEGKDSATDEDETDVSAISARDFVLSQCGQEDVLPFEKYFNERTLKDCKKIGEGVYGEVFMYNSDTVIKILPIEGSEPVNEEPQKTFEGVISEIVITLKLSNLRTGKKFGTSGFSEAKRCWCVKGKYPKYLIDLWDDYDQNGRGSDNDSPLMFGPDQLYIVLELANGGKDLEEFVFNSSAQSLSIFIQTAFSLAAAENAFEFEHRDLHWGNLLIAPTKDKFTTFLLDGVTHEVPTKGVKVAIIDFTLSRMLHDGCSIFNDLSVDPELFTSKGDYQFDIYRMMQKEVENDWSVFRPKTNIYWLHYTIDKMLKLVRYKNKKTQLHRKYLKELQALESVVMEYENSTDFVLSDAMKDLLSRF